MFLQQHLWQNEAGKELFIPSELDLNYSYRVYLILIYDIVQQNYSHFIPAAQRDGVEYEMSI